MEEKNQSQSCQEQYDIFLCTRELPDKLTAETAALRQLCSALAGEGYNVFFPSALPRELTDEERAKKIVDALKSSRLMVAAGVGPEGLSDVLSLGLWGAFLNSGEDAADRFFLCWRDRGDTPMPKMLEGRTLYDMSDLKFLAALKAALAAVLPPPRAQTPEADEASAEDGAAEDPEPAEPDAEEAPAEEAASGEVPEEKKPFPWKRLLIGAAVIVVVLWLIFRK